MTTKGLHLPLRDRAPVSVGNKPKAVPTSFASPKGGASKGGLPRAKPGGVAPKTFVLRVKDQLAAAPGPAPRDAKVILELSRRSLTCAARKKPVPSVTDFELSYLLFRVQFLKLE